MDTWKKSVLSAGKPVSIKFLVLGGGDLGFGEGGGSADFVFMGARIFLNIIQGFLATKEYQGKAAWVVACWNMLCRCFISFFASSLGMHIRFSLP